MRRMLTLGIGVVQLTTLLALIPAVSAGPTLLVDTGGGSGSGQPAFGTGSPTCGPQPVCQTYFQFLAGQFTLTNGATLDSVQGWMSVGGAMSVAVKIYTNDASNPANIHPGTAIYSQTYPLNSSFTNWVVFPNYNPVLAAGTYWLAFEPQPGSAYQIAMPGGAPNPLANYAYWANGNSGYVNFAAFAIHAGLGMRISGTTTTLTLPFGSFTRANQQNTCPVDPNPFDLIVGDLNKPVTYELYYSTTGIQEARSTFVPIIRSGTAITDFGPSVGAYSYSNLGNGTARGLAMITFQNSDAQAKTFQVNAVLDGEFIQDDIGLPNGSLYAAAGIYVVDTAAFDAGLAASGKTAGQFLLGYYPFPPQSVGPSLGYDPAFTMTTLRDALPGVLASYINPDLSGPFGQLLTIPMNTGLFVVQPGQFFTVMFDIMTVGLTSGAACESIPQGTGQILFLNSMKPAANMFTDASGNPVTGLVGAGSAPVLPPAATALTLAPPAGTNIVGTSHTVTATATTSTGAPVPGIIVQFNVTAGPNKGRVGAGLTDANGMASFTYIGNAATGTDTIQANIGAVVSNTVQETWKLPPCPLGQGFWKNHPGKWPVASLTLGSQTYSSAELLDILHDSVDGDASQILAIQLIAAKLNVANGSDAKPISAAISTADSLLAGFAGKLPYNVKPNTVAGRQMTEAAETLGQYNEGGLTNNCAGEDQ